MASPLESKVRKAIHGGMKKLFFPATITRDSPRASSAEAFDPLPPVAKTYACRAIVDTYSDFRLANGLIQSGDRKLLVLAHKLEIDPKPGDRVTVLRGPDRGKVWTAIEAKTDPANAVWEIQGRS